MKAMTFEEYQQKAGTTALYPNIGNNFIYPTLGLAGEVGEVSNKVQKIMRDQNSLLSDINRSDLKKELGDVLWFLAQLATELGLSLDEIAQFNIEKLQSRFARGTIQGAGDNR